MQIKCLLSFFFPSRISNNRSLQKQSNFCCLTRVSALLQVRGWRWIGHVLRTSPDSSSRTALTWEPEGREEESEVDQEKRGVEPLRRRDTSLNGIHGMLLSHRFRTAMDGVVLWLASGVHMGPKSISKK